MKRILFFLLFFSLAGCGPAPQSNFSQPPPDSFTPCTDCANRRIASHGIIFTGMDPATKDFLASAASASHAGMIRMDLTWSAVQPSPPPAPYDWSEVDASVQAAKKNNLDILALVAETPTWASSNPGHPSARSFPPAADRWDEWTAFIKAFVDRYGARGTNEIHYWEIWGEANDSGQWLGTPAEYARLYSVAYDAIKSSDPTAQVLMAGLNESKMPGWLDSVLNDPTYPAKGKIDIIDVHIRGTVAHVQEAVPAWRDVFQTLGGVVNKPIWVTEFGFPSDPAFQSTWDNQFVGANAADGEQKQADYYNVVVPWLLNQGGVDRLFVTLRDIPASGTPWESEGFITQGGHAKTAFNIIKTLSDRFPQ